MNFSVVIPVYFSAALPDTIRAVLDQTAYDRILEVLVIGQQPALDFPTSKFRHIHVADNPSVTHNRNVGLREAKGEWICYTDSDCIPDRDWLANFIPFIEKGFQAIGGAVDIPAGMSYWGRCHHDHGFENQAYGIAHKPTLRYAATLNFCIRRETLLNLGGFNEALAIGGEDRELCLRLHDSGIPIAFSPGAVVFHNHTRRDFRAAWNHSCQFGQNTANARLRHQESCSVYWQVLPKFLRIPVLGEFTAILRALVNCPARLLRNPAYLRKLSCLPGIFLLDFALGLGMAERFRTR
jgi:glycosyltransferase involved in cell wall biosynthesis